MSILQPHLKEQVSPERTREKEDKSLSSLAEHNIIQNMINVECREIIRKNQRLQLQIKKFSVQADFNFRQQWESKLQEVDGNSYIEMIQAQTIPAYVYTGIILFANIGLFWYIAMHRLEGVKELLQGRDIICLGFTVLVVDIVVKIYLEYLRNSTRNISLKKILKNFMGHIYLFLYFVIELAADIEFQQGIVVACSMDAVAVYLLYMRAKTLFHLFKIRSYTTSEKHKMKLLDLLGTLLLFLHVFALLLYLASFYDPRRNWTHRLDYPDVKGLERYFYAFYFASTTMLTIGYGDISPTNPVEILTILPIQVIGVAVFSYIISQIGYTVSSVRKEEEELEHNLSTLSKMTKFYKMDHELSNSAKENLISNQKSFDNVYPEDENAVLSKLKDDLREEVTFNNGLNVVKSSIFFLCHWTKQFQSEIAKCLIKKILHPNEVLAQVPFAEKIYIVKNGRLDVFTSCNDNYKQQFKRLLKTIAPQNAQEVSKNVYGYTSVISNRPMRLVAISKNFTTVYSIDKEKFLGCVSDNKLDWEYFHEIKAKIDSSKCLQSWEAPAVHNIRYHYQPSKFYIIKKYRSLSRISSNKRKELVRLRKRSKIVHSCEVFQFKSMNALTNRNIQKELIKPAKIRPQSSNEGQNISLDPKQIVEEVFQSSKQYENYFRKNNISTTLAKYQQSNAKIPKILERQMPHLLFSLMKSEESLSI